MKTEIDLARERRARAVRMTGSTPSVRAHYQFYKQRLSGRRTSSLAKLRAG